MLNECCRLLFAIVRAKADLAILFVCYEWGNSHFFSIHYSQIKWTLIFSIWFNKIHCSEEGVFVVCLFFFLRWYYFIFFVALAIRCIIHQSKRCSVVRFNSNFELKIGVRVIVLCYLKLRNFYSRTTRTLDGSAYRYVCTCIFDLFISVHKSYNLWQLIAIIFVNVR